MLVARCAYDIAGLIYHQVALPLALSGSFKPIGSLAR